MVRLYDNWPICRFPQTGLSCVGLYCFASAFLIAVTNLGCRSSGRTKIVSQPEQYELNTRTRSPMKSRLWRLRSLYSSNPRSNNLSKVSQTIPKRDLTTPIEPATDSTLELDLTPEIESATELEQIATPEALRPPELKALAESVRLHFPLIQQALASRTVASGEVLAASGAFDHKFEAFSNSQPLDFYENYRQSFDVKRDTYWGGEVFAGYRIWSWCLRALVPRTRNQQKGASSKLVSSFPWHEIVGSMPIEQNSGAPNSNEVG